MGKRLEMESITINLLHRITDLCYATVSGSIAYGTNTESSDIDVRGFYMNSVGQLLGTEKKPEVITLDNPDGVFYPFTKFVNLLSNCNPGVIELLGTRKEDQLYVNNVAQAVLDHKEMFLSKRAYYSFGGYAVSQFKRLENALYKKDEDPSDEKKLNKLVEVLEFNARAEREKVGDDSTAPIIRFSVNNESKVMAELMFATRKIEVKRLINLVKEIEHTYKCFDDNSKSGDSKKDDAKLYKHAMHLMRLYFMGIDILKNGEINTYREKEHDYLMSIRNGEVSMESIFKKQQDMEVELYNAYENSMLPDEVDKNKIDFFVYNQYSKYMGIEPYSRN